MTNYKRSWRYYGAFFDTWVTVMQFIALTLVVMSWFYFAALHSQYGLVGTTFCISIDDIVEPYYDTIIFYSKYSQSHSIVHQGGCFCESIHWNRNIIILTKAWSLAALVIVILETSGPVNDDKWHHFPLSIVWSIYCTCHCQAICNFMSEHIMLLGAAAVLSHRSFTDLFDYPYEAS